MDKDKSLTTRKEHALTKSQHTGGLIDKHLGQLSEQKPRDSEEIHEIEFRGGKYTGQIKDGMPHGKGVAKYSEVISGGARYDFRIRGEWVNGLATGFCVEDIDEYTDPEEPVEKKARFDNRSIKIGAFRSDELDGFGAWLDSAYLKNPDPEDEILVGPVLSFEHFEKSKAIGISAYLAYSWSWLDAEAWLEQESDFVVGNLEDAIEEKRFSLHFCNGVLHAIGHRGSTDYDPDQSESDAILNDVLVDQDGQVIRWHGPTGTSAEGAWITADVRGHSIRVLKLKSLGLTEGVRSKITSNKVVEISCGEWRPGEKFSGIRFELNSDFDKSRGPWFYRDGKQIAFPLFDGELG
jgi:hypothetical protein